MIHIPLFAALLITIHAAVAGDPSHPLLEVEDGDTLLVEIAGQPVRVQLAGIDAPEDVANPKLLRDVQRTGRTERELLTLGYAATGYLRSLLQPGTMLLLSGDLTRKDKYGRIPVVARTSAGMSLNTAMVQEGFAIAMHGTAPEALDTTDLRNLEARAIAQGKGLWRSNGALMRAWSGKQAD